MHTPTYISYFINLSLDSSWTIIYYAGVFHCIRCELILLHVITYWRAHGNPNAEHMLRLIIVFRSNIVWSWSITHAISIRSINVSSSYIGFTAYVSVPSCTYINGAKEMFSMQRILRRVDQDQPHYHHWRYNMKYNQLIGRGVTRSAVLQQHWKV